MMAAILLLLAILCCSSQHASAFLSPSPITKPLISCAEQTISTTESDGIATSRRSFAEDILGSSISLAFLSSTPCYASGGATAGGAYLLSAKQRYNERKSAALVLLYLKVNVLTYVTISSLSSSQIVITRIFQG